MKMQIESTEQITEIGGVPVRVWKGVTESGVDCFVFVHLIAVRNDHDSTEFERDLAEQVPPGRSVPLSHIL